jgi:hypothetical protein
MGLGTWKEKYVVSLYSRTCVVDASLSGVRVSLFITISLA